MTYRDLPTLSHPLSSTFTGYRLPPSLLDSNHTQEYTVYNKSLQLTAKAVQWYLDHGVQVYQNGILITHINAQVSIHKEPEHPPEDTNNMSLALPLLLGLMIV